jgi:hypothetical protein
MSTTSHPQTKTYVIHEGKHHVGGKVYHKGDRIELTRKQAEAMRYMVHRIRPEEEEEAEVEEDGEDDGEQETGTDDDADLNDSDTDDSTTTPVRKPTPDPTEEDFSFLSMLSDTDAINTINALKTVGEVEAAVTAERKGKNRSIVIAAGEARIPTDD